MSEGYVWTVILGLAVLTYLNRVSFLGLLGGRDVPPSVRRALAFVPSAVLPALVAPMVLVDRTTGALTPPSFWVAGAVALGIGVLTRNMLVTVLGGLAAFHLARLAGL